MGVPLVRLNKCNKNFLLVLELGSQLKTFFIAMHINVSKHTIDFPSPTSNHWHGAYKEGSILVTLTNSKDVNSDIIPYTREHPLSYSSLCTTYTTFRKQACLAIFPTLLFDVTSFYCRTHFFKPRRIRSRTSTSAQILHLCMNESQRSAVTPPNRSKFYNLLKLNPLHPLL